MWIERYNFYTKKLSNKNSKLMIFCRWIIVVIIKTLIKYTSVEYVCEYLFVFEILFVVV